MTTHAPVRQAVTLHTVSAEDKREAHAVELPEYERERFADVAFMTAMNLCLLGNYAQTGHFGGPLAYTPLQRRLSPGRAGPGGLRYDLRDPKFAYSDKFMLAGGHCIPTCYSLWMILYEALRRQHAATGDGRSPATRASPSCRSTPWAFAGEPGALATLLEGERSPPATPSRAGEDPRHSFAVGSRRVH